MSVSYDIAKLRAVLEQMLLSNITITARAVTRELGTPFKNASDITRHERRRAVLEEFQRRQRTIRELAEDVDKESVTNLRLKVARLEEACATLQRSRDLLVASHKAMLLAVGEMGGMRAWVKFFPHWDQVRLSLHAMGAIPTTRADCLVGSDHH
jgi:hypothetical protein